MKGGGGEGGREGVIRDCKYLRLLHGKDEANSHKITHRLTLLYVLWPQLTR